MEKNEKEIEKLKADLSAEVQKAKAEIERLKKELKVQIQTFNFKEKG